MAANDSRSPIYTRLYTLLLLYPFPLIEAGDNMCMVSDST